MVLPRPGPATLADLEALPSHLKGELIGGVLYAMTRPRPAHQLVATTIAGELWAPWQRGRGGPGSWWIVAEPGVSLPGAEEISPDLAGWQRARMPTLPREGPFTVVPDWVCEILSPTTRRHDLLIEQPFYARAGVAWCWLVDLEARVVTALRNADCVWVVEGSFGDEREARIPPFGSVPQDLSAWWADLAVAAGPQVDP